MSASKKATFATRNALVVGTIHSPGSLEHALSLPPGAVDVLEVRVDHFASAPEALLERTAPLALPLVITVRRRDEGGAAELTDAERTTLYDLFLPRASYIDVELRSAESLRSVIERSRAAGALLILSDHHFETTPPLEELRERHSRAAAHGADIFKLATLAPTAHELATLLEFTHGAAPGAVSVMGMGPFGKVSRLALAKAGSILNYGYLDQPQVPGQWEASELKKRIAEVCVEQ